MSLQGKTALVTGASRGIGRSAAIALATAGCDVAINFRSHPEEAEEVAAEVRKQGRRALLVEADVANAEAIESAVAKTVAEFGRLDVAVSNAAYSDRDLFYQQDLTGFHR